MSLLNPRSPLTRRIAVTTAAGVAVTPAVSNDDRDGGGSGSGSITGDPAGGNGGDGGGRDGRQQQGDHRGRVTADRLALRTSPSRGSQVIRYARRGETVHIYRKTPGDRVRGNPLRYLLTDGTGPGARPAASTTSVPRRAGADADSSHTPPFR
ncbi:SH3 domain-containing protein [Streptomyces sp. HO565]|uniref:SH3 domain-containing protein n=1 Tax=Streptomyces TaxID=1883 RepID=UPI0034DB9E4C